MSEDIIEYYRKAAMEKTEPQAVQVEEQHVPDIVENASLTESEPLNAFIQKLTESIKKQAGVKDIITKETQPEQINAPIEEAVSTVETPAPLESFISKFQTIVKASKEKKVKAATVDFINRLKDTSAVVEQEEVVIQGQAEPIQEEQEAETETEPLDLPTDIEQEKIPASKESSYVNTLKAADKNQIIKKVPKQKNDINTLISKQIEAQSVKITEEVKAYAKRILDLGGGGGSVAQQFANGGTMKGDLNVTGQYLSAGINLSSIFGSGGGGGSSDRLIAGNKSFILNNDGTFALPNNTLRTEDDIELILESENTSLAAFTQIALTPHGFFAYDSNGNTITFDSISDSVTIKTINNYSWVFDDRGNITGPNNVLSVIGSVNVTSGAYLSAGVNLLNLLSGSNTGDAAVNSLVHSNSALWNSTYTTVTANSASWSSVYTTVRAVSSQWSADYTAYTTLTANSANWESAYEISTAYQNASGDFATTSYVDTNYLPLVGGTITGRLGINNTPSSYDLDLSSLSNSYGDLGINAYNDIVINPGDNVILTQHTGNVGIGVTDPTNKLDVDGNIGATGTVTASGGNSDQWNSAYTISTAYLSTSGTFATTTLVNAVSSLLTPITTTNALTSQLVNITTLTAYQTSVATSTATLLPTSIYQNTSGLFVPNTAVNTLTGNWNSAYSTTTALSLSSDSWNSSSNKAIYTINGTANQITATPAGNNTGTNSYTLSLPNAVSISTLNVLSTLNVTGSANFYNTSNLNVSSNIIYFGEGNTGNALDLGIVSHFIGNLNNGISRYQHTGFARKAGQNSPGTWTLFSGLTTEPGSVNSNISWTDPYFQIDSLNANIIGSLSGQTVNVQTLTSNYIYGNANETVLTDGSNYTGHGSGTLTLNYQNGIFISAPLTYNGITSDNWNTAYSLVSGGGSLTNYVTTTAFNNYQTSVATSTATLLPTNTFNNYQTSVATSTATLLPTNTFNNYQTSVAASTATLLPTNTFNNYQTSVATTTALFVQTNANATLNSLSVTNGITATGGNSNNWNTAYSLVSGGVTVSIPQSGTWNSTTSTVSSLSSNWNSVYTSVNSVSSNWNSVYTFVNTTTATLFNVNNLSVAGSLSSTYLYGKSSETTLTDGTNLAGNGSGTLTLNYSNGVYISSNTLPSTDNAYNFGSGTNRWKAIYAANGTIQTSDIRQKINVQPTALGLNFINTLNPVSYNFAIGSNTVERDSDGNIISVTPVSGKRTHYGLIAQEVKQSIPQDIDFGGWVLTDINDPNSEQGLRYEEFISPMIRSIQELTSIVTALSSQNQQLLTVISNLTTK